MLDSPIEDNLRLLEIHKKALTRLGIKTIRELLYHFPVRYGNSSETTNIKVLEKGTNAVLFGRITNLKTKKAFRKKIPMSEALLEDGTGSIKIVWFHQPYLAKMIAEGSSVRIEGKVAERKGGLYISNPKIERLSSLPISSGESLFSGKDDSVIYPVYPESKGITSNWIYHTIRKIYKSGALENIIDPIPTEILKKYNLPTLKSAIIWIHSPKKESDALSARKRFAFEEVFFIQLEKQRARDRWKKHNSFIIKKSRGEISSFVERFPFPLTKSQEKAIDQTLSDFSKNEPMSRLLEGDVGSGKTAVAAAASFAVINSRPIGQDFGNLQVAYMVPTEILAHQHFLSFIEYFSSRHGGAGTGIQIGLITSSGCKKFPSKVSPDGSTDISRTQLLKWVENGEIPILIGTHSLIQKTVRFKHLALVIIDEQHRFGVQQRALLRGKNTNAEQTQNNAEEKNDSGDTGLLYKDLSYSVRQALFEVKKAIGSGHKEIIYQKALEEEFTKKKISFSREKQIPVLHNKKKVGVYVPDFVVEEKIIVELKALPFIGNTEKKQLWNYLKGSDYKLALLANFGPQELKIQRVVYDKARQTASVPQGSAPVPHLLSMTATPIPRTLALTVYGDLDLTLLDELPVGRKWPITKIVLPQERDGVYKYIKNKLDAGQQAYIICPRIDEPDPTKEGALYAKSVKEEAKRIREEIYPEFEVGELHGKLKPKDKEKVMGDFNNGKIRILVATSVVEVGVNVSNATIILIEGAERFGLAQLHQLRGRVMRSTQQPYCFVFTESKSGKSVDRLKALQNAKSGFELAEFDLSQRGSGELYGRKQWGISDLGMEAIKNLKMVEAARTESKNIIESDSELNNFPLLKERLLKQGSKIHFE